MDFFAAGEVEVVSTSLNITEGSNAMFCVVLMATSASTNELGNELTFILNTTLLTAGLVYHNFMLNYCEAACTYYITLCVLVFSIYYALWALHIIIYLSYFTESSDFSLSMSSITIAPGSLPTDGSDCINVTATDDTILEGDEYFKILITDTCLPEVTVGIPSTYVTISDNNGM